MGAASRNARQACVSTFESGGGGRHADHAQREGNHAHTYQYSLHVVFHPAPKAAARCFAPVARPQKETMPLGKVPRWTFESGENRRELSETAYRVDIDQWLH